MNFTLEIFDEVQDFLGPLYVLGVRDFDSMAGRARVLLHTLFSIHCTILANLPTRLGVTWPVLIEHCDGSVLLSALV